MSVIHTAKAAGGGSVVPLPAFPHNWAAGQRVPVSISNTYSAQLSHSTVYNVKPTVSCFITVSPANSGGSAIPASATAATSWPLSANETYTVVVPNLTSFLAVISAAGDGFIYIHPAAIS